MGVSFYRTLLIGQNGFKFKFKCCIDRLTFMELFFIFLSIYYFVYFILSLSLNYFVNIELLLLNSDHQFMLMNEDISSQVSSNTNSTTTTSTSTPSPNHTNNTTTPTISTPSNTNRGHIGVQGIMPTAIAVGGAGMVVGMKAAAASPTLAGKLGWAAGGVVAGGASIITAIIGKKIGEDIVKSSSHKFIDISVLESISDSLHLTGNNGIDLLLLIQTFQKLQLLFLFVIVYHFILVSLNEDKVENKLLKILPLRVVSFISKNIKFTKKYIRIVIICFFIILVICNIQSYYYLNFFIENLDGIIETYFKNKYK